MHNRERQYTSNVALLPITDKKKRNRNTEHDARAVSGELEKNGSATKNQQIKIEAVVKATKTGRYIIRGWVEGNIDTTSTRGMHVIEVDVNEESAYIYEKSPEPIREGETLRAHRNEDRDST